MKPWSKNNTSTEQVQSDAYGNQHNNTTGNKEERNTEVCQKVGHLTAKCQSKRKEEGKGKQLNTTSAWKDKDIQEPTRAPRGMLPMNWSEVTLLGQEDNLKQYIEKLENNLQKSLEDLHIVQDQINKVYWEDDLISEFDTTDYKIDITSMPPVPKILILQQQNMTLLETGEARVM